MIWLAGYVAAGARIGARITGSASSFSGEMQHTSQVDVPGSHRPNSNKVLQPNNRAPPVTRVDQFSSSSLGPMDLHLSRLNKTIPQIQIDQALIRHPGLLRHRLEVRHHVFRQAHGDRLLELRRVRIWSRLHLRKIVFWLHLMHPGRTLSRVW